MLSPLQTVFVAPAAGGLLPDVPALPDSPPGAELLEAAAAAFAAAGAAGTDDDAALTDAGAAFAAVAAEELLDVVAPAPDAGAAGFGGGDGGACAAMALHVLSFGGGTAEGAPPLADAPPGATGMVGTNAAAVALSVIAELGLDESPGDTAAGTESGVGACDADVTAAAVAPA